MRKLTYTDGIGTALAVMASLFFWWFAVVGGEMAAMYKDFGPHHAVGTATRIVLHPAWRLGLPLAIALGVIVAHFRGPRFTLLAIGCAAVGVAIATYIAAWLPVFEIAGNVRAD